MVVTVLVLNINLLIVVIHSHPRLNLWKPSILLVAPLDRRSSIISSQTVNNINQLFFLLFIISIFAILFLKGTVIIDGVDILVLLNWPWSWHIGHTNLLTLINKQSPSETTLQHGNSLTWQHPKLWRVITKSANGSCLIMVFNKYSRPSIGSLSKLTLWFDSLL